MTDKPDTTRAAVERLVALMIPGNQQPDMSGDSRKRLHPHQRRMVEDVATSIMDAVLAPLEAERDALRAEVAALRQAVGSARGEPDANISTSADVYLWLLDMAEEALIARRAAR